MSPTVLEFLRDRDARKFREAVLTFTNTRPGDTRRLVFSCFEILLPRLRELYPLVPEDEMVRIVLDRVANLDLPADQDELDARRSV